MKAVILAGGYGTHQRRKPVQAQTHDRNRRDAHIVAYHEVVFHFGHNDFIICCGYKQQVIKIFCQLFSVQQRRHL